MTCQRPLLECVPNFSEGRDTATIQAIQHAIVSVKGLALLHVDASPSANRTVFTFAGQPEAVIEGAYRSMEVAARRIDMRHQEGAHPRLGATDVCPLVPLCGIGQKEAIEWARRLARDAGEGLGIPVYLYEDAAAFAYRRALPDVRRGQYEGLRAKLALPEWQPDYGPSLEAWDSIERTGATIVGARGILVAFNISLNTQDVSIARAIARSLRATTPGGLPGTRAIGWYMEDFGCAQVSMNLLDYRLTSPLQAWLACKHIAEGMGVSLTGSELVGLMPEACLWEAGRYALGPGNVTASKQDTLRRGADLLGLDRIKPFSIDTCVLEATLERAGLIEQRP